MRVLIFGDQAREVRREVEKYDVLTLVEDDPEVVVCYGGDGTLLSAERKWPGVPKAPIRNSRRGNRCIAHPPGSVIERLVEHQLFRTEYMKLLCTVHNADQPESGYDFVAMNEINVHMGLINSAVRFRMWLDEETYADGREILGDGFVVSTPFGSTAYFSHITRGVFHIGIGVAFQNTTEHTNHVIVPESAKIRVRITRGPAKLAHDNSPTYFPVREGHELVALKHPQPAVILTWDQMGYPSDQF